MISATTWRCYILTYSRIFRRPAKGAAKIEEAMTRAKMGGLLNLMITHGSWTTRLVHSPDRKLVRGPEEQHTKHPSHDELNDRQLVAEEVAVQPSTTEFLAENEWRQREREANKGKKKVEKRKA